MLLACEPGVVELAKRRKLKRASIGFDDSVNGLTKIGMRPTDNSAGPDGGMAKDGPFDLRGPDIDAARDTEIAEPVGKIEIALGIESADVPHRTPALGRDAPLGPDRA